jgi:FixJ family two-component response regulator
MARTKRLQQVFWDNDHTLPKAATVPSPEDLLIAAEQERAAEKIQRRKKALARRFAQEVLSPQLYNVFQLRLAGREIAEIAEALGIAESTAQTYRSECMTKLREAAASRNPDKSRSARKKGA